MVRVYIQLKCTSGRRKSWYKKVNSVDTKKTNGYAFEGDFLSEGEHDLNEGDIIIEKVPAGSVKDGGFGANIYRVGNDLELVTQYQTWSKNFLSFRDKVAELLNEKPNPLVAFSDDELMCEVIARGLIEKEVKK